MGIVRQLHTVFTELLERYDEPGLTYVYPDTRFYWGGRGQEADIEASWEDKRLLLKFSYLDTTGEFAHRISRRVQVTNESIVLPAEWLEFMDTHFGKEG